MPSDTEKKLYAFWRYDLFPGCLGGEVVEFCGEHAKIRGMGGYMVRHFKIIEGPAGEKLVRDLRKLEGERQEALDKLNAEFRERRDKLITIPRHE